MVWQREVLGRRAKPLGGGWAIDDLQSLLGVDVGVDGDLVVKGVLTNPCQELLCRTKGRGPQGLVAAGLSRELKNPKKTSPPVRGRGFGVGP